MTHQNAWTLHVLQAKLAQVKLWKSAKQDKFQAITLDPCKGLKRFKQRCVKAPDENKEHVTRRDCLSYNLESL